MAKFCTYCGFKVEENDKYCPDCGAVLRTREEMQYCDHFCSECGAPIVTRTAEAVYRPADKPAPAPAPAKPSKTTAAQAKAAAQAVVEEKAEAKTDGEPSGGRISGCSVIFWLIVLAGIIYGCYYYIYLPYIQSQEPESGYTYGYGTTGVVDIDQKPVVDGAVQPGGDTTAPPEVGNQPTGSESGQQQPDNPPVTTVTQPDQPGVQTGEPSGVPNTQFGPQPIVPEFQMELLNFKWERRIPVRSGLAIGPFREEPAPIIVADGEVVNMSPEPLPKLHATVVFLDSMGQEVSRESVEINSLPIYPGNSEKLHLETKYDTRMYKARVEIRDPRGVPYLVKKESEYSMRTG